jgi:hypothetical protein
LAYILRADDGNDDNDDGEYGEVCGMNRDVDVTEKQVQFCQSYCPEQTVHVPVCPVAHGHNCG